MCDIVMSKYKDFRNEVKEYAKLCAEHHGGDWWDWSDKSRRYIKACRKIDRGDYSDYPNHPLNNRKVSKNADPIK